MNISLYRNQKVHIAINPRTPSGNAARVEATVINVSSGDAQVQLDDDGMGAYIIAGEPGDSIIEVTADVDLTEEVKTIGETIILTVLEEQASELGIVVGTPESQ